MEKQNVIRPYSGTLSSRKKELGTDAGTDAVWMKLETIMLNKKGHIMHEYLYIKISKIGKSTETGNRFNGFQGLGEGGGKGWLLSGCEFFFWDVENVLDYIVVVIAQLSECTNAIELCTLKLIT